MFPGEYEIGVLIALLVDLFLLAPALADVPRKWFSIWKGIFYPRKGRYPFTANQLKAQFAEQRKRRMGDVVGVGRRYVPELYVHRPAAFEVFRNFIEGTAPCLAILGESGVGKSNVMIAMSEMPGRGTETLFYEGVHLRNGLAAALKEDIPWAFRDADSFAETGMAILDLFRRFRQRLYIFIDALDDISTEVREEVIETLRSLSQYGIRFVVSCKDVVWPSFVRRDSSPTVFADLIFPPSADEHSSSFPGWTLPRCNRDELDEAWERYSSVFQLAGERSEAFNKEASLLYMLRLIGETFRNAEVPQSLDSLSLFDAYWSKKQAETGDQQTALVIVRELARGLLDTGQNEMQESLIWSQGLEAIKRATYDYLCREHVIVVRSGAQRRFVRFYHEKFRSYAVAILEGQWNDRIRWQDEQLVGFWIEIGEKNEVLAGAIDFYVRAVDGGETSVLSTFFRMDLGKFLVLVPKIETPLAQMPARAVMTAADRESISRKMVQRAICFDSLVNHHFPHLRPRGKPDGNFQIGCIIRLFPTGLVWGYRPITDEFPDTLLLDEESEVVPPGTWDRYGVRVYHSGGWSHIADELPQHLAFEDAQRDLAEALRKSPRQLGHEESRLWEWDTFPLVYERVWHLLFHTQTHSLRRSQSRHYIRGLHNVLGFSDPDAAKATPIRELLDRILYEMLWQTTELRMMIVKEESRQGDQVSQVLASPPDNAVTREADRIWSLQRFSLDEYNWSGELPDKLIDLYKCLEKLAELRQYLDTPLLPDIYHVHHVWSRVPIPELVEYLEQFIPLLLESYRSMVEENFPSLTSALPLYRRLPVFTVAEISTEGVRYAFIETRDRLTEHFGSSYVCVGSGLLPSWSSFDTDLTLRLEGVTYNGPASIYSVGISGQLMLQEQVYRLIHWDLKHVLRNLSTYL